MTASPTIREPRISPFALVSVASYIAYVALHQALTVRSEGLEDPVFPAWHAYVAPLLPVVSLLGLAAGVTAWIYRPRSRWLALLGIGLNGWPWVRAFFG